MGEAPDLDLSTASRAELRVLIAAQRDQLTAQQTTIGELRAQVSRLQAQVQQLTERLSQSQGPGSGSSAKGMPGLKPQTAPVREKRPRKQRAQSVGRARMTPTEQVLHAVESCPECATRLRGGSIKRRREVIEVKLPPVQVVEHVFVERRCPLCRKRWVPRERDVLGPVVGRRQRLGVGLRALIVVLREVGRLPLATIQWYLRTVHRLPLSRGALVAVVQGASQRGQAAVAQIREAIRASPVVHGDETGWREDGRNGYIWTFSTPTARYFLRRPRTKEVVDEVLGDSFEGVLVSDFYAAYHHYEGLHQRCWAHLLRDIHDLRVRSPDDQPLQDWAMAVHALYQEAVAFASPEEGTRFGQQEAYERRLRQLCLPFAGPEGEHTEDPDTSDAGRAGAAAAMPTEAAAAPVQRTLCARILRHLEELFVFVGLPEVPPDNNAAERSLRPLVTSRKISGGTRSDAGTEAKTTLASLVGTWQARGLDPLEQFRHLLISPQL